MVSTFYFLLSIINYKHFHFPPLSRPDVLREVLYCGRRLKFVGESLISNKVKKKNSIVRARPCHPKRRPLSSLQLTFAMHLNTLIMILAIGLISFLLIKNFSASCLKDSKTEKWLNEGPRGWCCIRDLDSLDAGQDDSWILDTSLDLAQECHSLAAVNQTMVVGQCDVHHRANDNLESREGKISSVEDILTCLTCPLMATGRSNVPCMPRMELCGGLIIGVPNNDPKTPPLLIVKVPPSMSSTAREPFLALSPSALIPNSISA